MKDYLNPSSILSLQQFLSSFNQLPLPKLSKSDQKALKSEMTIQEIPDAIIGIPIGKAPGPDGSGIEFKKIKICAKNHTFYAKDLTDSNCLYLHTLSIFSYF